MNNEKPRRWMELGAKGLALLGILMIATAALIFLKFIDDKENFIRTKGVVQSMAPDAHNPGWYEVTIAYNIRGREFKKTESSQDFQKLNRHVGDSLELMVDPERLENIQLLEAEPYILDFSTGLGKAGITCFMISIGLWTLRRFKRY